MFKNPICGDVIYDLRCSLLHQGDPNLNTKHDFIYGFELTTKNNKYNILVDIFVESNYKNKHSTYNCDIK